jgi:glycosyltransferase involved in cell wall biosynthesis
VHRRRKPALDPSRRSEGTAVSAFMDRGVRRSPSAVKHTSANILAGTKTMTIQVSVVVGTYNRAHLLKGTLAALASQEVPSSLQWEIIIVDNNSQDATARLVTTFATTIPLRYVFEPQQGLSRARNRGVKEARGSIIAFTDDDVLPASDWIVQVAAAIDRWHAHGVGGRILPRWEAVPPRWLTDNRRLLNRIAIMDSEESCLLALPLDAQPQVWGANMAFRRELFDMVGDFDPRRGVVGKRLFRGEDTDLINRALEQGLKIAYDAGPTVFHRIGPDRMRKGYFRRVMFDDAQVGSRTNPAVTGRSFLGSPLWAYRLALTNLWTWAASVLLRRPGTFDQQLACLASAGMLAGYWKVGLMRRKS